MKPTLSRRGAAWALAGSLLGALVLGGCATAPPGVQATDAAMRQADTQRIVAIQALPSTVRIGEPVVLDIASNRAGYLYVFQVDTNGIGVSLVFPNAIDGANLVQPGSVRLPRPNWRMPSRGPAGMGYLMAVVAERPQDLLAQARQVAEGNIAIEGPYGAAMTNLREVAP